MHLESIHIFRHLVAFHLPAVELVVKTVVGTNIDHRLYGAAVAKVQGDASEFVLGFRGIDILLLLHDAGGHLDVGTLHVLAREMNVAGIVHLVFVNLDQVAAIAVGHQLVALVSDNAAT